MVHIKASKYLYDFENNYDEKYKEKPFHLLSQDDKNKYIERQNDRLDNGLDSRFIDREDPEALKKAGLIKENELTKIIKDIKEGSDKVVNYMCSDDYKNLKEPAVKQFKEELKEKIKGLVDKWEGERIDNTIYGLSSEELNNMRLDDIEEILKLLE